MLLCFVKVASNPATALESHSCTFTASNSPGITFLRKNTRGGRGIGCSRNTPPPPNSGRNCERELSDLRQNLLLVGHNGVQRHLVFQNCRLILLNRLLIGPDLLLVGDYRRLIREDPLLICNASVGHVFDLPQRLSLRVTVSILVAPPDTEQ